MVFFLKVSLWLFVILFGGFKGFVKKLVVVIGWVGLLGVGYFWLFIWGYIRLFVVGRFFYCCFCVFVGDYILFYD